MKRAYVFVLREKQREILAEVIRLHEQFEARQSDDLEDYVPGSVDDLRESLDAHFGVTLRPADLSEGLDPEYLAGLVAEQVLERSPPSNMIPKSGN